jgi:hypothetical protein
MTATSTATPDTLTTMLTQAERAQAEANAAAGRAAEAQAKAVAVGNQIAAERDTRFVAWATARLGESPATEKGLAGDVDAARQAFDAAVSGGEPTFVAKYLSWAEAAARLYHARTHAANLKGHLHHRRPAEHPAHDAGRQVTHDSRTTVPSISDALARATAMASAARAGDAEDALQAELESALRGEDPATPDRRGG